MFVGSRPSLLAAPVRGGSLSPCRLLVAVFDRQSAEAMTVDGRRRVGRQAPGHRRLVEARRSAAGERVKLVEVADGDGRQKGRARRRAAVCLARAVDAGECSHPVVTVGRAATE